jgi:hypothetical protein
MVRLESAARPAVSVLETNAQKVIHSAIIAVLDAGLATVVRKVEKYNRARQNGLFDLEACA